MQVRYDFTESKHFAKELKRVADRGLEGGDKLSIKQMQGIWRATGKEIVRDAKDNAPRSDKTGKSVWSKSVRRGLFRQKATLYRYEGEHGDLRKMVAYTPKPFRSGLGVRVFIGDPNPSASSKKKLAGIVGNFAVHNVRRVGRDRSTKGPIRDWLGDANQRTMGKQARALVDTYHRAHTNQIRPAPTIVKSGEFSRLVWPAAHKTTGKIIPGKVQFRTSEMFHMDTLNVGTTHPIFDVL